jgi:hypothetical protein
MTHGIRKGLEDIAHELKGIKNILSSMWHSKYQTEETSRLHPESFTDEYISTEECARRLSVSDQTIRNWIFAGKQAKGKGWVEGIHYVNIAIDNNKRAVIRVPWTQLVQSFAKTKEIDITDVRNPRMYQSTRVEEPQRDE